MSSCIHLLSSRSLKVSRRYDGRLSRCARRLVVDELQECGTLGHAFASLLQ